MSATTRPRRTGQSTPPTPRRHTSRDLWTVKYTDARGVQHSIYGKTPDAVLETWGARMLEKTQGVTPGSRRHTLRSWLPVWVATLEGSGLRARSRVRYARLADHWASDPIAAHRLPDLLPEDVSLGLGRMSRRGLSVATQASALAILRLALDSAKRSGHLVRNVARDVDAPRPEPLEVRPPRGDDLERLWAAIEADPLEALWRLALEAGLRQNEALGLTWADVDLGAGIVNVRGSLEYGGTRVGPTKSRAGRRRLPIIPGTGLHAALVRHRDRDGVIQHPSAFLFATGSGRPLHARNVLRRWHALCARAGVRRYRFHDLRHAFATWGLERGIAPGVMSRYLGHSDLTMINRYSHIELDQLSGRSVP